MRDLSDRQWLMDGTTEASPMRIGRDDAGQDGESQPSATAAFRSTSGPRVERRDNRRFDIAAWDVPLDRWEGRPANRPALGRILDLSAGGIRFRTRQADVRPDQQIRVRLVLPDHGGISPFVDVSADRPKPTREWSGWLAVRRVRQVGTEFEVAGRLVDMEAMDRGMLGLYLSAQPLAA
jgi:hypothetical protein